ncbi:glycoside hydrolase family 127 protein [Paenibacillus xylaniclasticus]|uniref:glycoside hydrolase family 127 protein n=1 Tax=Paenibacillus xylaniclasticus TaxID=588083 RepID=UPI000FD8E288|nr:MULTISPECIES: beta-L-arabinofuranosidase domain-containing protein [Paenibacillus]
MPAVPLSKVSIQDSFWSYYADLARNVVIPYQWEALNDRIEGAEPSRAIRNFRIAAGLEQGEFHGFVFQDSDLYKWLEAVGYRIATHPDKEWEAIADQAIELVEAAQMEDGYLNTYYQIKGIDLRWTNLLDAHELYCAGHLIEAAVAYSGATGKTKLLDIACRFADHIDDVFGTGPDQIRGYCGHQEIELALVKLYQATGQERYLKLAAYFINERGTDTTFYSREAERRGYTTIWSAHPDWPHPERKIDLQYHQAHAPVREQNTAVGHAVRAVYMYTAMADLARLNGDTQLLDACRKLWNDITRRQMYITGGIGSTHHGESFSASYDLPNDTAYAETCASVGLVFFANRMLQLEAKSEYADVLERALYNTVIAGMALDGRSYFYVNPLEVWPHACSCNPGKHHVKPVRQQWFGCSCCPPNIARLLTSLGAYIYTVNTNSNTVYTHLYIGSTADLQLAGQSFRLVQTSNLPWSGNASFTISELAEPAAFTLALRIPAWTQGALPVVKLNGQPFSFKPDDIQEGYLTIERIWRAGDRIDVELAVPVLRLKSHSELRYNAGRIALQRGPLVYCFEETDNGSNLAALSIATAGEITVEQDDRLLPGVIMLQCEGYKEASSEEEGEELYSVYSIAEPERTLLRAVPYALWGNRNPGEMSVWIRRQR